MSEIVPSSSPESAARLRTLAIHGARETSVLLTLGAWGFFSTLVLVSLFGLPVGLLCGWLIPRGFGWQLLAFCIVAVTFVVEGWVLGVKRAMAVMIVTAVRRFGVSGRVLRLLFAGMQRLLGERSMAALQKVPLRQAEELLRDAIKPL